jgi:hypothetical protein
MSKEQFVWDSVVGLADPADPSAGANFTYTLAAGQKGLLVVITITITSSASVANRGLSLRIRHGAKVLWQNLTMANQTASRTNYYTFAPGVPVSDAADQVNRTFPFSAAIELPAGSVIDTVITNIQAADQVNIAWEYKEVKA